MTGLKVAGIVAAVGGASTANDVLSAAPTWERLGIVGICLAAVVVLWKASEKNRSDQAAASAKREEQMQRTVEKLTEVVTHNTDVISDNTKALEDVARVIDHCKAFHNDGNNQKGRPA